MTRTSKPIDVVALAAMLFVSIFVLNLSFRTREIGADGLDIQNGVKLGAWTLMLAIAGLNVRGIEALVMGSGAAQAALAFGAIALASSLWSPVPLYTAATAIGALAWLAFALVLSLRLSDRMVLTTIIAALGCEMAVALAGTLVMPDLVWMEPSAEETTFRLMGLSGHPNLLAQHAGLLVVLATAGRSAGLVSRRVAWAAAILGFVPLLASGGRTEMFATAAALSFAWVRRRPKTAIWTLLTLGAAAAWILALDLLPDLASLFRSASRTGDTSELWTLTGRTELWQIAWQHFLERPLLGWGFNGTESLMLDSVPPNFPGNPVDAHDMYLQGLMTLGVIGFLPVVVYLGTLLRRLGSVPDAVRDRMLIFVLVLGAAEAELLTVPGTLSFLVFWLVAREARLRMQSSLRRGAPVLVWA